MLDVEDVVLGKLRALSDRQAERDFVDIDEMLADGRWSADDLYRKLSTIRPEMTAQVQTLLRSAHLDDPVEYAALGLAPSGITAMLGRLNQHADQIGSGYGPGCVKKS